MSIQGTKNPFSWSEEAEGSSSAFYRFSSQRHHPAFNSTQAQVDQIVTGVFEHATNWKSLTAITVGGWAFHTGRMGLLSFRALRELPWIAQPLSVGVGLSVEVTAFEFTNRALLSLSRSHSDTPNPIPQNLWSLSGPGGWKEGWVSSFVNFGFLKGFGKFAEGQNLIYRHGLQDAGMVLGHQMVYQLGIGPKPEGTLEERFLNAEAMTLQVSAGMSLSHGLIPRLASAPRGASTPFLTERKKGGETDLGKKDLNLLTVSDPFPNLAWEGVSMMSMSGSGRSGDGKTGGPIRIVGGTVKPPPSPDDPLIGQTVDGRYRVEDMIGSGGMGIVYRCTHMKLGNPVAMKVLRAEQLSSPESAERFQREARAASSIANPHIIGIKDIGQLEDGSIYYVMEYLEGVPLSRLMEGNRPAPVSRIVPIARQIAVGLGAAHAKGVVHRDLKPGNIHLVASGADKDFVKILDFGIAKVLNDDPHLTLTGMVLGTPRYMSPEQARGDPVDHRSDIYSFGALLYKMATGKVPFDSESQVGIMEAIISKDPTPIRNLNPKPQEVPPLLDAIILKSLSKSPSERYQSMDEVIADLDRLGAEMAATPLAPARRPSQQIPPPPPVPEEGSEAKTRFIRVPPGAESEIKSRPQKARWPLYLTLTGLGAGSVIAALFAGGKLSLTSPALPPDPAPAVPPPPEDAGATPQPDAAPPAPTLVLSPALKKVELTVDPPDARVFQDGQEMAKPLVIEIEPGKTVKLEIRREGYKPKKITLDHSQDQVTIHLDRETKKTLEPPPKKEEHETPEPDFRGFE